MGENGEHRQSNWELLRIVAMLMIIAGHFIAQSEFRTFAPPQGTDYWFSIIIGSGSRVAVNLFLALGCWFMVDASFRASRLLRLYFNVWTITVPLTLLVLLLGFPVSGKDILRGLFPFVGKALWFASAYIMLLAYSPWLAKVLAWEKRTLRQLLLLCLLLISAWVTFWSFDRTEDQWLDILVWFSFMYVFMGYYKRYVQLTYNKYLVLFLGVAAYLGLSLLYGYALLQEDASPVARLAAKMSHAFLEDYKTLPNLFITMCIFYYFQQSRIAYSRVVNYLATGAFTAYILHQTPAFIWPLWHAIFQSDTYLTSEYRSLYALLVIGLTYMLGLLVERLRRSWLEPRILSLAPVKWSEKKIDAFYNKI